MTVKVNPPREIEVTLDKGIKGTIAVPHSVDSENAFAEGLAPSTHKMALILHGQGGHRNYCYQRHVAHALALELGIYSLRIDFRGSGDSAENIDSKKGRILKQDIEDIQTCAEFITDKLKNPLGISFVLSSIIGHSRGSLATFLWSIEQNEILKSDPSKAFIVPNIVNCSSRYQLHTVLDRYPIFDEEFQDLPQLCYRYGKTQVVSVPREELLSLYHADLSKLPGLSMDTSVLSIYGLEDTIVPIVDSAHFANALNRGPYSHRLELIPGADHNFYGIHPIETPGDEQDYNPNNLPLNSKKLVNYSQLVTSYIIKWLQPENELNRFYQSASTIGYVSRWKQVEGVSNFRDSGGWKITKPTFSIDSSIKPNLYVKPGYIYRCANTAYITEKGKKTLQELDIKVMFDLRSDGECAKAGVPQNLEKYGVKRVHAPVFSKDDYSPQLIALRYTNLMTSWSTYVHVYEDMLELGIESFKTVFKYIRDDGRPFVFHCTAGKDRTGIIGMLILLLLGVDKNTIAKEYELTTIGLKSDHPILKKDFIENVNHMKEKFGANASDIEDMIKQGRQDWTVENDGFQNLISSRYEAMLATIELFNEKYGNIIEYLKNQLGFSEDDIKVIYNRLIVSDELTFKNSSHITHQSHLAKF